jgi:hypothetical protein
MFEGTRRTSTYRGHGFTIGFTILGETNHDIECCHLTDKKDCNKILSGIME